MTKQNIIFTTKGGKEIRLHTDEVPNGIDPERVRAILNEKRKGTDWEVIQVTELNDDEIHGDTFINLPDDFGKDIMEATKNETATESAEEKEEEKPELTPIMKQFLDMKKKRPDALFLFRCGDFYETYCKDAEKAAQVLGITLTKSSRTKDPDGKPLAMAGFPYHALDTYLPKLIRAGVRVAICDQIEAPKPTVKRGITEKVKE